jgi:hypothetical protein
MIIRILNEGQWQLPDDRMGQLNALDEKVETAVDTSDEAHFADALAGLLDAVRTGGERLPDDSLEDSDLILPPADATIDEVRALLTDEGLIPG